MPWGAGAAEAYFAFSRRLDKLIETDPRRDELSRRGAENAVRLATIVAVGRGANSVDRADIEWAIKLAERSIEAAAGGIERYMREYLDFRSSANGYSRRSPSMTASAARAPSVATSATIKKPSSTSTTQSANSRPKAVSRRDAPG